MVATMNSILLRTDSYKVGHHSQLSNFVNPLLYGSFRSQFVPDDNRIVFCGRRQIQEILQQRVSWSDLLEAEDFYSTYNVGQTSYNFPLALWRNVVNKRGGELPFRVSTALEGTVVGPNVPFLTVQAVEGYEPLIGWLEPLLLHVWSASTTATKSAFIYEQIKEAFDISVDENHQFLLGSRLHDFGYRGISSTESAKWTALGHLLFFEGTDTIPAAYKAYDLNGHKPFACSVQASEHSVMMSHLTDEAAVKHLIESHPQNAIYSVVADTHDYVKFLTEVLPKFAQLIKDKNHTFIVRPDSGDAFVNVASALGALNDIFGSYVNSKGYRVLNNSAVIQGDGVTFDQVRPLYQLTLDLGYSAQNLAVGMGGGLLQKQNRDTLSAMIKLSYFERGTQHFCVHKNAPGKVSLSGIPRVTRVDNLFIVNCLQTTTTWENKGGILWPIYSEEKPALWSISASNAKKDFLDSKGLTVKINNLP